MNSEWMAIEAYFAPPGSERNLLTAGIKAPALLDAAADITVISQELLESVFGNGGYTYSVVNVKGFSGALSQHKTVPMLVGLVIGADTVHAQVDCLVSSTAQTILGSDVLSLLGLAIRIDYQNHQVQLERYTWDRFEDEVASLYRAVGASVKQNVNLAGFQIDMLVHESTQSGQKIRFAVECKYYKDKVGNRVVNDFSRIVSTIKTAGLVDRGVIVAHRGFTQDASLVAQQVGIELLTLEDLKQQIPGPTPKLPPSREKKITKQHDLKPKEIRRFFVVMPFVPDLDDVYHFGIRETIARIGGVCERADEIQYTGGILEKIYDSIRRADAIIAEVSSQNPNVYYEIGFAHALGKPVVLVTRDVSSSPFDLRGYNHIVYSSIVELRKKLEEMLRNLSQ